MDDVGQEGGKENESCLEVKDPGWTSTFWENESTG